MSTFILIVSIAGVCLLSILSLCSFIEMEALKLHKNHGSSSGGALLVAAIVIFI